MEVMKKKLVAIALTIMMPAPMFAGLVKAETTEQTTNISQTTSDDAQTQARLKTGAKLGATVQTTNLFKDPNFTKFGNQGNAGWLYSQAGLFDNSLALSKNLALTGDEYKVYNPIDYKVYVKPLMIDNEAAIQIREVTDTTAKVNSSFGQQMTGLEVGKSYTVSADYRVASSDVTDGKNELYFSIGTLVGDGLKSDKAIENTSVTVANDDTTWKHYTKTFTATAGVQLIAFGQFPNSTDAGQTMITQYKNMQLVTAPPANPTVSDVDTISTTVTGKTDVGAKISVKVGDTEIGTDTADVSGNYTVTIPKQAKGTVLQVTAENTVGISDVVETTVTEAILAVANPQTMILGTDISKMDPKVFVKDVVNNGENMTIAFGKLALTDEVGTFDTEINVTDNTTQTTQKIIVPTSVNYGDTILSTGLGVAGATYRGISAITIHHGEHPYITNSYGRAKWSSGTTMHSSAGSKLYYENKLRTVTDDHELGDAYFDKAGYGNTVTSTYINNYGTPSVEYGDILEFYHNENKAYIQTPNTEFSTAKQLSAGTHYFEITPTGYHEVLKNNITTIKPSVEVGAKVQPKDFVSIPAGDDVTVSDTFVQAPDLTKPGTSTVQVEVQDHLSSGKYLKRTVSSTVTVKDTTAPTADGVTQVLDKDAAIPSAESFVTNIQDNGDDYFTDNTKTITYKTPPTMTTVGARTAEISVTDKAGNTLIKKVPYFVKDAQTTVSGNYAFRSEAITLTKSELKGKNTKALDTLVKERANVQAWNISDSQEISGQVILSEEDLTDLTSEETHFVTAQIENITASVQVTVVDNTILQFNTTPETLGFETAEISSDETTINRSNPNWNIQVKDTRNNGSHWAVTATVNGPFVNTSDPTGKKLQNALIYTTGNTETRITDNQAFPIFEGTSNAQQITTIEAPSNQGIHMKVNPTGVKADADYETSITWTLNDTP